MPQYACVGIQAFVGAKPFSMVLILDGSSEHFVHVCRIAGVSEINLGISGLHLPYI